MEQAKNLEYEFVEKIKQELKKKKIPQKKISKKMGVSPPTVSAWLAHANKMNLQQFIEIMIIFKIPIEHIFNFGGDVVMGLLEDNIKYNTTQKNTNLSNDNTRNYYQGKIDALEHIKFLLNEKGCDNNG